MKRVTDMFKKFFSFRWLTDRFAREESAISKELTIEVLNDVMVEYLDLEKQPVSVKFNVKNPVWFFLSGDRRMGDKVKVEPVDNVRMNFDGTNFVGNAVMDSVNYEIYISYVVFRRSVALGDIVLTSFVKLVK